MIKIDFLHTIGGIVIVMIIQLLSALSILITVTLFLSKFISYYSTINEWCSKKMKVNQLTKNEREFTLMTLETSQTLVKSVIEKLKTNI